MPGLQIQGRGQYRLLLARSIGAAGFYYELKQQGELRLDVLMCLGKVLAFHLQVISMTCQHAIQHSASVLSLVKLSLSIDSTYIQLANYLAAIYLKINA